MYCYSDCMERKGPNMLPLLLIAVAALLSTGIIYSQHALKHSEAPNVQHCLRENGPLQIWEAKNADEFLFVCIMNDGRWGIQPLVRDGEQLREKTAFVQNSKIAKLLRYLGRSAEALDWNGGTLSDAIKLVMSR